MTKTDRDLRAIHARACAAVMRANRTLTPDVDAFWPLYLRAALTPEVQADAARVSEQREVIQPLEEPVTIKKAMLAGRLAHVVLDKGVGPVAAVHLVNIGITGWVHTEETAEAYSKGFNTAAAWMQEALLAVSNSGDSQASDQTLRARIDAAYAALDAVADWAKQEGADDEMEPGTRLLALLLKHGVHPR